MKVLFVSLGSINSINEHALYVDLLREFVKDGHQVTIVSPHEKRSGKKTELIEDKGVVIIRPRIGNFQKTNYFEKMISTILLPRQILRAVLKYKSDEKYDIILFATPPMTIYTTIKILKRRTSAITVLMLKDIWPQEMIDLGLIGEDSFVTRYFKAIENEMYKISDYIGYASKASRDYLIDKGISSEKLVEINNGVDPFYYPAGTWEVIKDEKEIVFFYGGNMGVPQDVDFIIQCLKKQINIEGRRFVLCGQGTDYRKLQRFIEHEQPQNIELYPYMPKEKYDELVTKADIALVFLNHKFTVPNCPARFYTYMECSKPIIACTDLATDIRYDIEEGDFGWWCESKDANEFGKIVNLACEEGKEKLAARGKKARAHLESKYTAEKNYHRIIALKKKH